MKLGIDTSTYLEEAKINAKYYIDGKEVDPLDVFRSNGVSYMRIRLWNDPFEGDKPYLGGTNDLNSFIKIAHVALEKGYELLLDFHFSDFWADPGKQTLPKAWQGLSYEEVKDALYHFVKDTLNKIKEENIPLSMIQVGNEITNGMCWPHGKLIAHGHDKRTNYENFINLLKEGIKGCNEVYPNAKIMIHLERSGDKEVYQEFFDELVKEEVNFDVIGLSYYQYWHGTFNQLFANIDNLISRYGKEIVIAELGYGFTLEDYIKTNNGAPQLVINEEKINAGEITIDYPLNEEGQAQMIEEFLLEASKHNVSMVFYWEPLWIPGEGICWASVEGQKYINEVGKSTRNEWANQCLYDYEGKALKGLFKFKIKED